MSRSQRQAMKDRDHDLLDVSRALIYYRPEPPKGEDLELITLMDRRYLKTPFYGSRKMRVWLSAERRSGN